MNKLVQFALTAAGAAVVAFVLTTSGCSGETVDPMAACQADPFACNTCENSEWCGGKKDKFRWICKSDKTCQKVCQKQADCRTGEVCEVGVCRPPGCGTDAECNGGQQCIGGACATAPVAGDVKSCQLLPTKAILHQGGTESYSVVARDAQNRALAYKGAITWASSADGKASVAAGVVTGGAEAGDVEITATIGGVSCKAQAKNFASVSGNKFRVVVADLLSKELISGAKVVIGDETKATADGVAEFDGVGAKPTVSVYDATHAYVTVVGSASKDLVVYLKPGAGAGKFKGSMTAANFDNLTDLQGNIHLMLSGASIPGNLIDIQLSTLLGELVKTKLKLSPTQEPEVPLPAGTVIGMGVSMFKGDFEILAPPGVRAIWGLGGNAQFGKITAALGPALGGNTDDLNVGSILTGLLPLVEALQSGVLQGEVSTAGTEVDLGSAANLRLKLTTMLRLRLIAELPKLPTYKLADKDVPFEGAILVGGAMQQPQGFIPLGITAGVDMKGATVDGKDAGDGKIDSTGTDVPDGSLGLRVAPLHSGLETAKFGVLALAASFGGLVPTDEENPDAEEPETPLVLSGLVGLPGDVKFPANGPQAFKVGEAFLGVPENPTLGGREFKLNKKVDGAAFHRLDIGNDKTGEWFVYFDGGDAPASFQIPTPPTGLDDRLNKIATGEDDLPQVLVQSIGVRADSGLNFDKIVEFDGKDADDLSAEINAFSVREILRPNEK